MDAQRSDEALMLAYRDGDATAFELLYRRHRGRLYRYLLRQCGGAAAAEELFQDIWLKVVNARGDYVVSARFTTWLFRIARNRLVDHWRAAGRDPARSFASAEDGDDPLADEVAALPGPAWEEPQAREEQRRLGAALLQQIEALPAPQREAFLLTQETDMTLEEIAALTGVSRETAKSRLRYALDKLRRELKAWR